MGGLTGIGTAKNAIFDAVKAEMTNQGMSEAQAIDIASEAQAYDGENLTEILISGGAGFFAGSTGLEKLVGNITRNVTPRQ